MKYRLKEFRPGLWHIMEGSQPVYDHALDGQDKPLIFRDYDLAWQAMNELNLNAENKEET